MIKVKYLINVITTSPMNPYEILNCSPNDSIDDIKKSYQTLILKYHPDKQIPNDQNFDENGINQFHRIDKAWKLLRDPDKRKQYDAEMRQNKFNDEPIIHAKIYRNEFEFNASSQIYTYPCRCGGFFVLPEDFIESEHCDGDEIKSVDDLNLDENNDDDIYIECDECSFVVQLLRNNNNKYQK